VSFDGVIIALDVASMTGIGEGSPWEKPDLYSERFRRPGDSYEESWGRAIGWIATKLQEPRQIYGTMYGPGEAVGKGLIRVAIEAPIMTMATGDTNADALLITKCLWAVMGGFSHRRGALVRNYPASTVRKAFVGIGKAPKGSPDNFLKKQSKRVCNAIGWAPPNLDAADAAALWWYACREWAPDSVPDTRPFHYRPQLPLGVAA
jgi:Holliday junction resolvasome RuvABC endonuclease subunit